MHRSATAHLVLLLLPLVLLPGCGGCRRDSDAAKKADKEKEKEPEKPKPDFDPPRLTLQPSDLRNVAQLGKPGHWASATLELKANNFDFRGELDSEIVDFSGRPVELDRTPFRLVSTRPAALVKGQKKYLDLTLFVPPREPQPLWATRLRGRLGGEALGAPPEVLRRMMNYQYYFFVLARQPERYSFLKQLDSTRVPGDDPTEIYRVLNPPLEGLVPLPSNPLAWTSIAFMLWDDVPPNELDADQQRALLDWLYWGGQLIVSGPNTLDLLRGSFIEPYLPAKSTGAVAISTERLAAINARWTLDDVVGGQRRPGKPLAAVRPWTGVALEPTRDAHVVPDTSDLFVERRVGRGRIVVTAAPLNLRDLLVWPGFDGFFNACVLRHPPRRFSEGKFTPIKVTMGGPYKDREHDPQLFTELRFLSRDTGFKPAPAYHTLTESDQYATTPTSSDEFEYRQSLGMWDDFGVLPVKFREALREAAGIEIPRATFVVWAIAGYLTILVPLNYLVFRMLGRVEWAWFAAPLIAIAATVMVTKLARLDIGFTRSQREIGTVEMQAGYPRAHVSRFTALYSSLSDSYDLHFDDPSALAQPFSTDVARISGQSTSTVRFRRGDDVTLADFPVTSNSTGLVRSEHMLDLKGAVSVEQRNGLAFLNNGTSLKLAGAAAIRRQALAGWDIAWIGDLAAGESHELKYQEFEPVRFNNALVGAMNESERAHGQLPMTLYEAIAGRADMQIGDVRLVAWTFDEVPGMRVEPAASQHWHVSFVVVHMAHGPLPAPTPDLNTRGATVAASNAPEESLRLDPLPGSDLPPPLPAPSETP